MPYVMKLGNILDSTDDAIINSLGIHTNVYGRLCKNIIEEAKSTELKNYIDNLGQVNILDTFVTKGYNLKAKNIIHIVTPFKKYDNDSSQLTKAYEILFSKAIENGYKSLSISFIGTGANGYSDVEASNAISLAVDKIISEEEKLDKDIIKITLYVKPRTREEILKEVQHIRRETSFNEFRSEIVSNQKMAMPSGRGIDEEYKHFQFKEMFIESYKQKFYNGTLKDSDRMMLASLTSSFDDDYYYFPRYLFDSGKIHYPYDYIQSYVYAHCDEWKKNKELKYTQRLGIAGINKNKKFHLTTTQKINSKDLFSIAFTFGMSKEETLLLMAINGTTFNILDKHSLFYLEYLNGIFGPIDTMQKLYSTSFKVYQITFGNVEE